MLVKQVLLVLNKKMKTYIFIDMDSIIKTSIKYNCMLDLGMDSADIISVIKDRINELPPGFVYTFSGIDYEDHRYISDNLVQMFDIYEYIGFKNIDIFCRYCLDNLIEKICKITIRDSIQSYIDTSYLEQFIIAKLHNAGYNISRLRISELSKLNVLKTITTIKHLRLDLCPKFLSDIISNNELKEVYISNYCDSILNIIKSTNKHINKIILPHDTNYVSILEDLDVNTIEYFRIGSVTSISSNKDIILRCDIDRPYEISVHNAKTLHIIVLPYYKQCIKIKQHSKCVINSNNMSVITL
jgi:hypothetical protein